MASKASNQEERRMNMTRIAIPIGALVGAFAVVASALAQSAHTRPMVEWVVPALRTYAPQAEQEAEASRQHVRKTPAPEILQPTLDPALLVYSPPRKDLNLRGSFKDAASDVLPGLVQLWVAKFKQYYPNLDITLSPPYAGRS
jgi:phosphate transport system substrate-binding protein